jgi:hypothetical protein
MNSNSHYFDVQNGKVYHDNGNVIIVGKPEEFLDAYRAIDRVTLRLISDGHIGSTDTLWTTF